MEKEEVWRRARERGGRTPDARKNAATVRQRTRATGVRRDTKSARKRVKEREREREREKKNTEAFFPFYGLDIIR